MGNIVGLVVKGKCLGNELVFQEGNEIIEFESSMIEAGIVQRNRLLSQFFDLLAKEKVKILEKINEDKKQNKIDKLKLEGLEKELNSQLQSIAKSSKICSTQRDKITLKKCKKFLKFAKNSLKKQVLLQKSKIAQINRQLAIFDRRLQSFEAFNSSNVLNNSQDLKKLKSKMEKILKLCKSKNKPSRKYCNEVQTSLQSLIQTRELLMIKLDRNLVSVLPFSQKISVANFVKKNEIKSQKRYFEKDLEIYKNGSKYCQKAVKQLKIDIIDSKTSGQSNVCQMIKTPKSPSKIIKTSITSVNYQTENSLELHEIIRIENQKVEDEVNQMKNILQACIKQGASREHRNKCSALKVEVEKLIKKRQKIVKNSLKILKNRKNHNSQATLDDKFTKIASKIISSILQVDQEIEYRIKKSQNQQKFLKSMTKICNDTKTYREIWSHSQAGPGLQCKESASNQSKTKNLSKNSAPQKLNYSLISEKDTINNFCSSLETLPFPTF